MNSTLIVLAVIGAVGFILAIVLAAGWSRHAKSGARDPLVIGATGFVNTRLDPDGSILIDGELWRARSKHGAVAPANSVTVVGVQEHLLLVEPMSDKLYPFHECVLHDRPQ